MNWSFLAKTHTSDLVYDFYKSIHEINEADWNAVVNNRNIYLCKSYLSAVEDSKKDEIQFRYIIFYDDERTPVAVSYVQLVDFHDRGTKYYDQICKVQDIFKNTILSALNIKVMVCGNVFSCGENGFLFTENVNPGQAYAALCKALFELRNNEKSENKVSILLLKEFWPESFNKTGVLTENDFKDFEIDVNMVLPIHPSWNNLDDYLFSMVTKFRTKAKGAFKKSKDLVIKDFSSADIKEHQKVIEELYQNVVERADFTVGKLNHTTYEMLKDNLGENFIFRAYYLNDQMVGFTTALISDEMVDAGYVGLNYEFNLSHAIYQRMLYEYVILAIERKVKELRLGRTAEQIKSCLGAVPTNMKLFVRHKNTVSNHLITPIVESISPSEFELRKPFKASFNASEPN